MKPADEIWRRVQIGERDECWPWLGVKNQKGYGMVSDWLKFNGSRLAHRLTYEYLIGPIPDGLVIDHLCRNPGCVNPYHMEPVTNWEWYSDDGDYLGPVEDGAE